MENELLLSTQLCILRDNGILPLNTNCCSLYFPLVLYQIPQKNFITYTQGISTTNSESKL